MERFKENLPILKEELIRLIQLLNVESMATLYESQLNLDGDLSF